MTDDERRQQAAERLEAAARILRRPSRLGLTHRQAIEAVTKCVARAFEHLDPTGDE